MRHALLLTLALSLLLPLAAPAAKAEDDTETRLDKLADQIRALAMDIAELQEEVAILREQSAEIRARAPASSSDTDAEPAGPGRFVGAWDIDTAAMAPVIDEMVKAMAGNFGGEMPPEFEQQMRDQIASMSLTVTIAANGTFSVSGTSRSGADPLDAAGTWATSDEGLTLTTTHEDGQPKENGQVLALRREGEGLVLSDPDEPGPLRLILRRVPR